MGCGASKGTGTAGKKDVLTILLIGLDNSGKTTLTYTLKKDFDRVTVPTVGFNQPTMLKHSGKQLKIYDLGGGARIRGVWKQYFHEVHGAIFMVDSADDDRFEESKAELLATASHEMLVGKPLLVLGNKADLPASKPEADMARALGVPQLALCAHQVYKVTAKGSLIGDAIDENITSGLDWLVRVIDGDYATLQARISAQTEQFAAADAARREAASAQAKANLAARAAAAAAAAQDGSSGADASKPSTSAAAAAAEEEKPAVAAAASKPKPAAPACFVPGCGQPAVRRAQAAGWQAVCDACGDALLALPVSDLKARLAAGETSVQVLASLQSGAQAEEQGATASSAAAASAGGSNQGAHSSAAETSEGAPDRTASATADDKQPQMGSASQQKHTTPRSGDDADAPSGAQASPARAGSSEPTPHSDKQTVDVSSGHESDAGDAVGHTEEEVTIISPNKMAAAAHGTSQAGGWQQAESEADDLTTASKAPETVAVPGAVDSHEQ